MNLEKIRQHMGARDRGDLVNSIEYEQMLRTLADDVPDLVAEVERINLQSGELQKELRHQKELWELALPILNAVDDRAGVVPFGQLHDPMGSIDRTLAEKRVEPSPKDPRNGCIDFGHKGPVESVENERKEWVSKCRNCGVTL